MIYIYSSNHNNAVCEIAKCIQLDGMSVSVKTGRVHTFADIAPVGVHIFVGQDSLSTDVSYSEKVNKYLISTQLHDEIISNANALPNILKGFDVIPDNYGFFALQNTYDRRSIYVLPSNAQACRRLYRTYLQRVLFDYSHIDEVQYFKLFGLNEIEVKRALLPIEKEKITLNYMSCDLDTTIALSVQTGCDRGTKERVISEICKTFEKEIYSLDDSDLASVVVSLLTLKGKKLSLSESVTGGMIASQLVNIAGASKVLFESAVTYCDQAKHLRLRVSTKDLDTYTAVSTQVAQQMMQGLLDTNKCDYALSITGYADKSIDFSSGMCYICVGNSEFLTVSQKHFIGDRNEVRRKMTNNALFILLNFLKRY